MNIFCLSTGIAKYHHVASLPESVTLDARAVYDALATLHPHDFDRDHSRLLLDDEASAENLRFSLHELAQHSTQESTVFIYLSCHGGRISESEYSGSYLLPVDAEVSHNDPAKMVNTSLGNRELTQAIAAIPARKLVLAFDCCHADGMSMPKGESFFQKGLSERFLEELRSGRGRAVLSSSRENELSWVLEGDRHSLFTKHLLNGLLGEAADDDGFVRIFNLFEYLQPRISAEHNEQHPVFHAHLEDNFPLAFIGLEHQRKAQAKTAEDYEYEAYISFQDEGEDARWVWEYLLPELRDNGVSAVVSHDVAEPGVARVVGIERGIRKARRTVMVLSDYYLENYERSFEHTLAQSIGTVEGQYRLVPVTWCDYSANLPDRLNMLVGIDLCHPYRRKHELQRLIKTLKAPLPTFM